MSLEEALLTRQFADHIQRAHIHVIFTGNWLYSRLADNLKRFELTPEQYNVLRIVRGQKNKPILVRDITARMMDRCSNTTRIIDKLEHKKLVSRLLGDKDKREKPIVLTDNGKKLLENIDRYWQDHSPHSGALTQAEEQILDALLEKLRNE